MRTAGLLLLSLLAIDWPMARTLPAVLRLLIPGGQCSAVAVAPTLALTASHCLHESMTVEGHTASLVEREESGLGIALLRASDADWKPLKLAPEPKLGAEVMIIGFGLNSPQPLFSSGVVVSHDLEIPNSPTTQLWISTPSTHGMSGGPVIDHKGRLVSVIIGGFVPGVPLQHLSTAAPYTNVRQLVRKYVR